MISETEKRKKKAMAKMISTKRVKDTLAMRHNDLADAFAYSNATGEENVASRFAEEKDVVLDIARDLFGASSYTFERVKKNVGGVDFQCKHLVWKEERRERCGS